MITGYKDRMINIYTYTSIIGDFGESINTLSLFRDNIWAEIIYGSGNEGNEGEGVVATNDVYFIFYYLPHITEKCLILYDNNYYDIKHIEIIGRNNELKIKCEKRDNNNVITS
jgi:hypothetical protein